MKYITTVLIGCIVLLGSCSFGVNPDTEGPGADVLSFDEAINFTYAGLLAADNAEELAASTIGASATITPDMDYDLSSGSATIPAIENYPNVGLQTSAGVTETALTPDTGYNYVYRIEAVTTAMGGFENVYLEAQVEETYLVQSADQVLNMNTSLDPIYDGGVWGRGTGSGYRERFLATYTDGSSRNHSIQDIRQAPNGYASFDINGSLDFSDLAVEDFAPATDAAANYSSQVWYYHRLNQTFNYWFWNEEISNPVISGTRYYTEYSPDGGTTLIATSLSIEYVYRSVLNLFWQRDEDVLAGTIIREQVTFTSPSGDGLNQFDWEATDHQQRMQTEINNTAGGANLLIARNGKSVADWRNANAQASQIRSITRAILPGEFSTWAEFETVLSDF